MKKKYEKTGPWQMQLNPSFIICFKLLLHVRIQTTAKERVTNWAKQKKKTSPVTTVHSRLNG